MIDIAASPDRVVRGKTVLGFKRLIGLRQRVNARIGTESDWLVSVSSLFLYTLFMGPGQIALRFGQFTFSLAFTGIYDAAASPRTLFFLSNYVNLSG
jgi:hypothetical protein